MEINSILYKKILELSNKGETLFELEKFDEALIEYRAAFALIPNPKGVYEASSWLLAASGDCLYQKASYNEALEEFQYCESCSGGLNPFVWLRIGQCYMELGDIKNAREYFIRSYATEGEKIFSNEDPKYLTSISDLIE